MGSEGVRLLGSSARTLAQGSSASRQFGPNGRLGGVRLRPAAWSPRSSAARKFGLRWEVGPEPGRWGVRPLGSSARSLDAGEFGR